MASRKVRVLLVDDHDWLRAAIRALLRRLPEVEVVGEAADGHGAVELTGRLRPDVVLMDVSMPGMNGIEAAAEIRKREPETKVVILSLQATEANVEQALGAGAIGYIVKDGVAGELGIALSSVMRGERYVSLSVLRKMVDRERQLVESP